MMTDDMNNVKAHEEDTVQEQNSLHNSICSLLMNYINHTADLIYLFYFITRV